MDTSDTPRPPPLFYRVQHNNNTFSVFDDEGFAAHYPMPYHHWITPLKFPEHLNWNSRPLHCTPFLSVFDNKADALQRVRHHIFSRRDTGVVLIEIDTRRLHQSVLEIESGGGNQIQLPVWEDPGVCVFISTVELRRHIGVQFAVSQLSEWFAIQEIPASMMRRVVHFDQRGREIVQAAR